VIKFDVDAEPDDPGFVTEQAFHFGFGRLAHGFAQIEVNAADNEFRIGRAERSVYHVLNVLGLNDRRTAGGLSRCSWH
jgi:hypothetical protein